MIRVAFHTLSLSADGAGQAYLDTIPILAVTTPSLTRSKFIRQLELLAWTALKLGVCAHGGRMLNGRTAWAERSFCSPNKHGLTCCLLNCSTYSTFKQYIIHRLFLILVAVPQLAAVSAPAIPRPSQRSSAAFIQRLSRNPTNPTGSQPHSHDNKSSDSCLRHVICPASSASHPRTLGVSVLDNITSQNE